MIWLRMYPEVVVLSGMFMISPTTVQREVRMILPLLWHYFRDRCSGLHISSGLTWQITGNYFLELLLLLMELDHRNIRSRMRALSCDRCPK